MLKGWGRKISLLTSDTSYSVESTDNLLDSYRHFLQTNSHSSKTIESRFRNFKTGYQNLADAIRADQFRNIVALKYTVTVNLLARLPIIVVDEANWRITMIRII